MLKTLFRLFSVSAFLMQGLVVEYAYSRQEDRTFSLNVVYENWLSATEEVYSAAKGDTVSAYDRLSEKFYQYYTETGDPVYLDFSLHEAGRNKREEIIHNLTAEEYRAVSPTIRKLEQNRMDSSYYAFREFSPEDIYTFLGRAIPQELAGRARELLDHWHKSLPADYQEDPVKASFKAQALIHGYFQLNEDQKVYEIGLYLTNSNPFPPSAFSVDLFNKIAFAAKMNGYYSQALSIYQSVLLPYSEALNNRTRHLTIRMDYANSLFRIGNVEEYLKEYEYIYSEIDHLPDSRYRTALFNNLAISYLNTGQFDRYVQFQLEAFDLAREQEEYSLQLSILRNLFIFYRRQNETDLAFSYLNQALQLAQENDLNDDISSILISSGIYQRTVENNLQKALDYFYEALELAEEANQYFYIYNVLLELAETQYLTGEHSEAISYIHEAIELSRSRNDFRNYLQASIRYANILVLMEKYEKAKAVMAEFSDRDFRQLAFNIRVMANNVIVRLQVHEQAYTRAEETSSAIVEEVITWLRESTDHQTGHMRMDEEFTEAFRLHTDVMHHTGHVEEALSAIGELRNISRSRFYNNPLLKSKLLSEQELIADYNLSNRIQTLRSRYAEAGEEQRVYLGNELLDAISERNALLNRAFPGYEETAYMDRFSDIRRELAAGQMVLYFSVFGDQIFLFTVTRAGADLHVFPEDERYLALLRNAMDSIGPGTTDLDLLHNVYTTFFESHIPPRIDHIYIVPDSDFYRLPVEILPVEQPETATSYGSTRYFTETYSVSYLNTLTELLPRENESPEPRYEYDVAGFGIRNFAEAGHSDLPDLPYSTEEVLQIAEKMDRFTTKAVFLNGESTKANFQRIAGNARILHLATHSKVDNETPLFSTLYLHSENGQPSPDNGIVHAYELFDMNLNADLVFLSACESGAGGYLRGAGVLGFSRAFAYAGAKSLSMNLWPVQDQTASEISRHFYEALNNGNNKAKALQKARTHYINHRNSDPYLWGGFVLYGDIRSPLPFNVNRYVAYPALILFLSLIAGITLFLVNETRLRFTV